LATLSAKGILAFGRGTGEVANGSNVDPVLRGNVIAEAEIVGTQWGAGSHFK
jgi:hypothetical protein